MNKYLQERVNKQLRHCLDMIKLSYVFTEDMSEYDFLRDKKTIFAVSRCIDIISTKAIYLQKNDENVIYTIDIPLKKIARMKDIIDMSYGEIDPKIIWKTVKNDFNHIENIILKNLK